MKIFAMLISAIQNKKLTSRLYIKVAIDGYELEQELIKKTKQYPDIDERSIKIVKRSFITLNEVAQQMEPELEKMIKNTTTKQKLVDIINKLPVN